MPPSLDEWLPEEHLARFVAELLDQVLACRPSTPTTGKCAAPAN
jgi:hypothetical protein